MWLIVQVMSFSSMAVPAVNTSGTSTLDLLASTPMPTPALTNTLEDRESSTPVVWPWILIGVLAGCLLVGFSFVVISVVTCTAVRKKRKYKCAHVPNSNGEPVQGHSSTGVSLVKTMKYCRDHFNATTDRPTNINSHVTAKKAERRQLNHAVEVVNEGDLSASKKAHAGDRVAAQTRPHGPRVALSTKPREEQGEEYDSDYSEVAITSDVQDSLGISIYQNVAYDLYGDDIATVDSIHQEAATFCGPVKTATVVSGVPRQVKKNVPKVRTKPKGETSSSSGFEASVQDDDHKGTEYQHLETSIISVYDMVRSEYGGELEAQSAGKNVSPKRTYELLYCNTSYGVQESAREQYCHNYKYITREMSELGEALYSNLEDNPEHDYENLKIKPGASDSAGDKVFCGNLNEDTEENEYYNQAEILHGD